MRVNMNMTISQLMNKRKGLKSSSREYKRLSSAISDKRMKGKRRSKKRTRKRGMRRRRSK